MAVPAEKLPKALGDLAGRDFVSEAVILSTCHRTEIYAVAERFHGAMQDIRHFLSELAFAPPEDFSDHLFTPPRRSGGQPPVRRHRRPRLGGARRERDARPGPQRVGAGPGGGGGRHQAVVAVPARPGGRQAGPHRDGHRPGHHVAVAGGGRHGHRPAGPLDGTQRSSSSARARWAPAWPPTLAPGRRGHRRQPHPQAGRGPGRAGRRPGRRPRRAPRARWPTPTSSSPPPARRPSCSPPPTSPTSSSGGTGRPS